MVVVFVDNESHTPAFLSLKSNTYDYNVNMINLLSYIHICSLVPRPHPLFNVTRSKEEGLGYDVTTYTSRNNDVEQVWPHFRILYEATHVRTTTVPRVLSRQDRGIDVGKIQDNLNVKN